MKNQGKSFIIESNCTKSHIVLPLPQAFPAARLHGYYKHREAQLLQRYTFFVFIKIKKHRTYIFCTDAVRNI
jgi:hypothetical protein